MRMQERKELTPKLEMKETGEALFLKVQLLKKLSVKRLEEMMQVHRIYSEVKLLIMKINLIKSMYYLKKGPRKNMSQ
jgi:hypothetical protein